MNINHRIRQHIANKEMMDRLMPLVGFSPSINSSGTQPTIAKGYHRAMAKKRSNVAASNNKQQRRKHKRRVRKVRLQEAKLVTTLENPPTSPQKPYQNTRSRTSATKDMMERLNQLKIRDSLEDKANGSADPNNLWHRRLRPRKSDPEGDMGRQPPLTIRTSKLRSSRNDQDAGSAGSAPMDISGGRTPGSWSRNPLPDFGE